jgi:IPT/TIG domain/PEGA domain
MVQHTSKQEFLSETARWRLVSRQYLLIIGCIALLIVIGTGLPASANNTSPPTITSISPTSGPFTGGNVVTIIGSGFSDGAGNSIVESVTFDNYPVTPFTFINDTEITVIAPSSPDQNPRTDQVIVTTSNGASSVSGYSGVGDYYTYLAPPATSPPTVTSISTTSGPLAGGNTITITGTGFSNSYLGNSIVNNVMFGSTRATSFTYVSGTTITAIAPAESAGTVDITVTTTSGTSATSTVDKYTYTASPPYPIISSISPTSGPITGGTQVTITGGNFTGFENYNLMFGSTGVSSFSSISDSKIIATAPAESAGTVDIVITTPYGSSAISTADEYTYTTVTTGTTTTTVSPTPTATINSTINGSILFESTPSGASIYLKSADFTDLNNTQIGTTPFTLYNVIPGDYSVLMEENGYLSNTETITVTAGNQTLVNRNLILESSTVTVPTTPASVATAVFTYTPTTKKTTIPMPTHFPTSTPTQKSPLGIEIGTIAIVGTALLVIKHK